MTIAVLVYTIVYTASLGVNLEFDWDFDKNELNILNHEIDFADLKDVFEKTPFLETDQIDGDELRHKRILRFDDGFYLTIVFTYRDSGNVVRFISAFSSSQKDRKAYDGRFGGKQRKS